MIPKVKDPLFIPSTALPGLLQKGIRGKVIHPTGAKVEAICLAVRKEQRDSIWSLEVAHTAERLLPRYLEGSSFSVLQGREVNLDLRDQTIHDHVVRVLSEAVPRTHIGKKHWRELCEGGVTFHGGHGGFADWKIHPWTSCDAVQFVADEKNTWDPERYDIVIVPALAKIPMRRKDQRLLALQQIVLAMADPEKNGVVFKGKPSPAYQRKSKQAERNGKKR